MLNEKDILIRLQNGEDAQKIADEIASVINSATKTYAEQQAAEEAKKKTEVQKKEDLKVILDMFCDWFGTYYDMNIENIKSNLKVDQVLDLIDSIKEYVDALKGLETMFSVKPIGPRIIKNNTSIKSADEQINDFLKKMGW